MSSSLRFTEGEYGFSHLFQFPSNTVFTGITGARLIIQDEEVPCTLLLDTTMCLTVCTTCKTVTWNVACGTTDFSGRFEGIVHITGCCIVQKSIAFPVTVTGKKEA